MKIVLHYRAGPGFLAEISSTVPPGMQVVPVDERDDAAFAEAMRDADVLWHVLRPVAAGDIAGAPNLKLIQKLGVGVNTIDLESAKANGVAVCNMPGTNSAAVAESTLGLMLAVLRKIAWLDFETRNGRGWQIDPGVFDRVGEIGGRVVGFLGYGGIPRKLTPALTALGAEIIFHTRTKQAVEGAEQVSLDELLSRSDILSLHIPLTGETRGILDANALEKMKPGSVLVNTARGGLVDEDALYSALTRGRLSGAGLDVFEQEPAAPGNRLLTLPQVVASPHIAWLTPETMRRSISVAVENCERLARGAPLLHRVV